MTFNKKQLTTIAIHIFIWVAFALLPLLFKPKEITFNTSQIQGIYLNLGITIVLFYLGYLFIIPRFFYKKRIVITLLLLVLASAFGSLILGLTRNLKAEERVPPSKMEFRRGDGPPKHLKKMRPRSPLFDNFFFFLLVSGAALSIRATQKWMQEETDRKTIEADKAHIELAWLKNQVSPHFFFNTLNNIHSLIESKPNDAQKSIQLLSKLMRYLLYESNATLIPLSKEVAFIESYIGLMKLKLTDNVKVNFSHPAISEKSTLPPLLFNPLIENAFKFGISYEQDSFINIDLANSEFEIVLTVENSIAQLTDQKEHSGIGLENLKQRLELLYKNNYTLDTNSDPKRFKAILKIPIHD